MWSIDLFSSPKSHILIGSLPMKSRMSADPMRMEPLHRKDQLKEDVLDIYFSADVETDGPIPGPYSILSFALVYAGSFDGRHFQRPENYSQTLYRELRPISENFEPEALRINGLDRPR